jgi:hypothetical protein
MYVQRSSKSAFYQEAPYTPAWASSDARVETTLLPTKEAGQWSGHVLQRVGKPENGDRGERRVISVWRESCSKEQGMDGPKQKN